MITLETKNGILLKIEQATWSDAKLLLQGVDDQLINIIDAISPDDNDIFYKASYPFGNTILKDGKLYFSDINGNELLYNDLIMPKKLIADIQYKPIINRPFAICLNKYSECCYNVDGKSFPFNIIKPGNFIGLKTIINRINPKFYFNNFLEAFTVTSGARNIFLMPKVSDAIRHRNLKLAYNIKQNRPQFFTDHWAIFKDIAQFENTNWQSEYLFFSNSFLDRLSEQSYYKLAQYFLNKYFANIYLKEYNEYRMILNYIEQKRNLKFSTNVLNMAEHLFSIALGHNLCFQPAVNDNFAPIKTIQFAYTNGYGLTDYCPIIMEPTIIDPKINTIGYYFQNYHLLPQFEFETIGNKKSIMSFIKELQFVLEVYQDTLKNSNTFNYSILNNISKVLNFHYYHNEQSDTKSIKSADDFFKEDARFLYNQVGKFPEHSPLLRGCTKIEFTGSK